MTSIWQKRALRAAALLAALTLLLAACSGGEGEGAGEQGGQQVELRFSWWGSDTRHQLTNKVIERFQQEHPNIKITGEFTGWDEYWDRLATTVAGNDAPDIIQMEWRYLREYADRGVLRDLSGLVDTKGLDQSLLTTGQVDGKLYAVPAGVNAFGVVADPKVFEQAGVALPDDTTWTWEDYQRIAAEISAKAPEGVYGAQEKAYNDANLQIFARQRGEDLYSEDGLGFSPETLREWWQISLEMMEAGATPPASVTSELEKAGVDQSLAATGKGGMGFWWTNELKALSESSGNDELTMLRFPGESTGERPGMYLKPSMFFSISSTTEHPEEAAQFINFLLNDPAAAEILLAERGLPVNTSIREQIIDKLPEVDRKGAEFIAEISGNLAEPPGAPPKGAGEIVTILQRMSDEVLFKRMSVDEATQQFMKEAEAALE